MADKYLSREDRKQKILGFAEQFAGGLDRADRNGPAQRQRGMSGAHAACAEPGAIEFLSSFDDDDQLAGCTRRRRSDSVRRTRSSKRFGTANMRYSSSVTVGWPGAGRAFGDEVDCAVICDLAIHPDVQASGYGGQILEEAPHAIDARQAGHPHDGEDEQKRNRRKHDRRLLPAQENKPDSRPRCCCSCRTGQTTIRTFSSPS